MANYIEIKNANGNVIVDDRWSIPKFLYRGKIKGGGPHNVSFLTQTDGNSFKNRYTMTFLSMPSFRAMGFDMDDTTENWRLVKNNMLLFAKSELQAPFRVTFEMHRSNIEGMEWDLKLFIGSDWDYHEIEFCLYTNLPMIPCKMGAQAFNERGELIFDAMRGYLQVIGTMSGGVNVRQNPAATYRMPLPPQLDTRNVFMSFRSTLPFYSAYNIGANGVRYGATFYFPVMRTESQTIVVDLVQQYNVEGSNSATEYNMFYEHMIYCPYPGGVWISGV